MVSASTVENQLRRTGHHIGLWGRSEVRELSNILLPGEEINDCVNGHYLNGFAMLCATNQRIILIDAKPMFLTVEDIRYDMIAEIDYSHSLLNATIKVFTPTKSLVFTSWNITRMRRLATNSQQHVLNIRQFQNAQSQSFARNYVIGNNFPKEAQKPIAPTISEYNNPGVATTPGDENISLASFAINHAMTTKAEALITKINALTNSGINSGFSNPSNPFVRSSFRSRNRLWPRTGLIPRR
jgi:Bacterial PH domain